MGSIEPKNRDADVSVLGSASINGHTYWCCQKPDGSPVIESQKTGKYYALDWGEIIFDAIAAGIDTE